MNIVLISTPGNFPLWLEAIREGLPDQDVLTVEEVADPGAVDVLVSGFPKPGLMAKFPNVRLVISLMAGVERLLADPDLPDVPLVRSGAPEGDEMIDDFALMHVLRHHRHMHEYAVAQRAAEWSTLRPTYTRNRKVGFLGLGNIAQSAAERVRDNGFQVASWTRSPKNVQGIESFHGDDQLEPFLARSEIVVNLLALTPATENILSARTFAMMPDGASVINLGRGEHVNDEDLIAALDSGRIAGATLDVFRKEPLPPDHPFWAHPRITITPHASRTIMPATYVPQVVAHVRRLVAGEPPQQLVDRQLGY